MLRSAAGVWDLELCGVLWRGLGGPCRGGGGGQDGLPDVGEATKLGLVVLVLVVAHPEHVGEGEGGGIRIASTLSKNGEKKNAGRKPQSFPASRGAEFVPANLRLANSFYVCGRQGTS
jgi:hypothetical protein